MHQDAREERVPQAIERFVKQMLVTYKAVNLYPPTSDIPRTSAADLLGMLRLLLREYSDLRLLVAKDALIHEDVPALPGQRPFEAFAREFYNRYLAEVRFHAGATARELIDFMRVLQETPEDIHAAGGFEQRLWDMQVDGITVRMISTKIVDSELPEAAEDETEEFPPPFERIDALVGTYRIKPRDQRVLVRYIQNPRLVSSYLEQVAARRQDSRSLIGLLAAKIAALSRLAAGEMAGDQPELFRSIAEGLLSLDADTRQEVLVQRLLPDSRTDAAIAGMLRQLELNELCRAIAHGLSPDPVSQDGVARAIRNLALISSQPKDAVLAAARSAIIERGLGEDAVASVIDRAAPKQLRVRPADEGTEGVAEILKIVDLAPVAGDAPDDEVGELRSEVSDGISDGDILFSIVTLLTFERRPEMFGSLMAIVEDSAGLLLELGEYEAAADTARALADLEPDTSLDPAQRERVKAALAGMAAPGHMREVGAAMRRHEPGTPEYDACRRLLSTLGTHTVGPFLEVLADEPDMAVRKSLVDLIGQMAPLHISELGARLSDPRWYFVRNVVNILGSTRSAESLPHLNRTLRHPDARVRRETIRAIAGIRDRFAEEMLVASLSDDDVQNVGLAARFLATAGVRTAWAPLVAVARGEGRGNRQTAARIEAIEALGRLGLPESVEVLREIARPRGLMRGARAREVRAAAETALAVIERRGGGA